MKLVYYILTLAAAITLCSSCTQKAKENEISTSTDSVKTYDYMTTVRLTVSESKRLIAIGIAAY